MVPVKSPVSGWIADQPVCELVRTGSRSAGALGSKTCFQTTTTHKHTYKPTYIYRKGRGRRERERERERESQTTGSVRLSAWPTCRWYFRVAASSTGGGVMRSTRVRPSPTANIALMMASRFPRYSCAWMHHVSEGHALKGSQDHLETQRLRFGAR